MKQQTYGKKVLQYFKNPKHVGEIKKPDGVGEVGNPTCLPPYEKIHKNPENIPIHKLQKGDYVLTHSGGYESVITVFSRLYTGGIISIKNQLGKVKLTPEHLVLAISIPKKFKFLRNKNKRRLIASWYHAGQLKKGDIILYPLYKEEKDLKYIKINIPKAKWDFKSKKIPNKVPVNSDLLRLFGYFLSEGNIQHRPSKTYISFTLNIKEKEIVEDIKKICKKLFGIDIKVREIPKRKTTRVYLYNARLTRFFKSLFGNGAEHKKIPRFIMNLPVKKQKFIIFGLWKGDGFINLNREGPRAGYTTVSYQLAQQIKILLLRQKISPSTYVDNEKESKGVFHKTAYRIHVGQRDSLIKLCKILKIRYFPKSYISVTSWFDNNYLYLPITRVRNSEYDGKVYNLEVENHHSFVSEAACLHNCGDVMHIFIKVKNNKITDIKFRTFGCIAAISSTEALCRVAKGKTLEKAKKITAKNIMKELGGLPTIKIHCSVLGADALRKAIENYEKKKK